MKIAFLVALALALITPVSMAQDAGSAPAPTPVCSCPTQCSRMWATATEWIERVSRMKLQIVTDSLLETYNADDFGAMTGRVMRVDDGNGKFEIKADFEPYSDTSDGMKMRQLGTNLFNGIVGSEAITTKCSST